MRPNFGTAPHDPCADNTLVQGLGPIYSRKQIAHPLSELPPPPPPANTAAMPGHLQLHMIMVPRDLHMLNLGDHQSRELIDLIGRQKYRYLDPALRLHCNRLRDEIKQNAQRLTDEALARVLGIQPGMAEARIMEHASLVGLFCGASECPTTEQVRDGAMDAHHEMVKSILHSANGEGEDHE
jgi:hypothetical protein